MNSDSVVQLFPQPTAEHALEGLYLDHDLRSEAGKERAFVFTNYVTSLDGRIAVPREDGPGTTVPDAIKNERDWRLFQELAVQADVIITSGRYLRDYEEGKAQEILQVYDNPEFADLGRWREERGLSPQPDLAVISGSLDFPIPHVLVESDRRITIFTHGRADKEKIASLREQTGTVVIAGEERVHGRQMVDSLTEMGYQTVFQSTGPKVNHVLAAEDQLDRLYVTFANRLLGGAPSVTLLEGATLKPAIDMTMRHLYYDAHGLDGLGQLFAAYDRHRG